MTPSLLLSQEEQSPNVVTLGRLVDYCISQGLSRSDSEIIDSLFDNLYDTILRGRRASRTIYYIRIKEICLSWLENQK